MNNDDDGIRWILKIWRVMVVVVNYYYDEGNGDADFV